MAVRAPGFGDVQWHNSAPLSLNDFRGKTVLLDFFTYCCINCLNNIYALKALREKYGDELVVIGVHSPKFEREKDNEALGDALKRLGIGYPVINDADKALFDAYAVKAWPSMVLIDGSGYEVARYSGEGHTEAVAAQLAALGVGRSGSADPALRHKPDVLRFPQKVVATDAFLAVANTGADSVLLYDYDGVLIQLIDGLNEPMGMAYDGKWLYVANRGRDEVVRIALQGGEKETLLSGLRAPYDLVVTQNELIVALAAAHQIVIYDKETLEELQRIGNGSEALRDGNAASCQLAQPSGVAYDGYRLWFVDAESSSLRYVENGEVKTAVGEGLFTFGDSCDGELLLQHPQGLDIGIIGDGCGGGRIFMTDTYNNKIKVFSPDDGAMFSILEGLHEPSGIAKKTCQLYIADTNAHAIIRFDLQEMKAYPFI